MSKFGLSRQRWMEILIPITATSMILQYVMQGILVSGESIELLSKNFWYFEWGLWGLRAFVESMVILYLFKTEAKKTRNKLVLTFIEFSLIALIALTLGPTLRAFTVNQSISEMLNGWQLTAWAFGVASYSALMMAGVGVAFRIQPSDVDTLAVNEHNRKLKELKDGHELELSTTKANQLAKVQELESELEYLRMWKNFVTGGDWSTTDGIAITAGFVTEGNAEGFAGAVGKDVIEVKDALSKGAELRRKGEL